MSANGLPPVLTVPLDSLRPPSADSPRVGLTMSVVAHAGLVAALTLGVSWRAEEPTAVSAELWAATPQIAAPPAAAPAPEPEPENAPPPRPAPPPPAPAPPPPATAERDADIALEKARRQREEQARQAAEEQRRQREKLEQEKLKADKLKAEKEKADKAAREKAEREKQERERAQRERAEKEKADKARQEQDKAEAARREKAAEAQREKLRQDQMRRMNEQLGGSAGPGGNGAPGSTGAAARDAGPSASYAGRILARVKPNIVLTDEVPGNPRAEVEMKVGPDGTIIGRRITQSSGVKAWDDAVLRAVDRTAVLPRDTDGRVPPTIVIGFRPRD